jgi:hypothetical protein
MPIILFELGIVPNMLGKLCGFCSWCLEVGWAGWGALQVNKVRFESYVIINIII